MREDEEEYQLIFHDGPVGEDDEDLKEEDNNDEGNKGSKRFRSQGQDISKTKFI